MMLEQDNEVYEFNLTIKEIKLTVKFPCKLTLNYQNKVIKADVTSDSTGKYIIERQVKTKSQNSEPMEILIHLTTEKGGNIMAGIIKLNPKDLSSSEGQSLTVGLQKCLDQNASCLLKVQRAWLTRNSKAKSLAGDISRNRRAYGQDLLASSKKQQPTIVDNYRNVQTRSELPGFNLKKPSALRKDGGFEGINQANKLYGLGPKSYVPQIHVAKSKNLDRSIELRKDGKFRFDDDNKTVGKREVDPSYRLTVQANEKNLKMDIMKYKMKAEEQQKTIQQKNKQIKLLKEQLSQLHRQSVQKGFYQEQINSKNQIIQKLEDTSKALNKENNRLESKIIQLQRAVQESKNNFQSSLQRAKDEKERKQSQMNKQLTMKKDEITLLNDEVKSKNNQISRIKKIIEDLQKSLQVKTFDYEKSLQGERSQMAKLEILLNDKIKQLEEINRCGSIERQNLQSQLRKKTEQVQKLQVNTNHLMAQIKQVTELQKYYATYKTRFTDLEKAFEKLEQEKKQVEKHYLKLVETKEKDYGQFKEEQSGLISSYKRKNTELTEKNKIQATRILELQNKISLLVADMDKLRRNLQLAQKQLSSLSQNWKSLNQSMKQKDELLLSKQKELSQLESKLSTRESLMKKDIEYKTEQLAKITSRLSEQQHLYRQQKQTNENLRFESTKIEGKNKLQEEIISRLNRQVDELKVSIEKRELQYKEEFKELNEKIKQYEQIEKKLNKQLTQCQMLDLNRKNEINRLNKELEISKQKVERQTKKSIQLQTTLKELNDINAKVQQKLILTQQQLKELQNNKKVLEADFTKTEKIKTIIVEEKTSVQNELANLKKEIENRMTHEQSLNKEIKELKEEVARMTLKANNSTKDFQSFKQNLYNTIQASFYSSSNKSVNKSFNFAVDSPSRGHQRYSSSSNINNEIFSKNSNGNNRKLHESDVVSVERSYMYEPRFNQIIESYGRESQQTLIALNDTIRKNKSEIQRLEKQSSSLSARLQSTEQETTQVIQSLERELQNLSTKNQQTSTLWEEKLMMSERGNRQKQKVIDELNDELQSLNHQLAANSRTHQIQLQELALKIEQLKAKNYDLQAKNDFASMTILSNEQKMFALESTLSQIQEQLQFQKQKVDRKDKLIIEHTFRIQQLAKLVEDGKKQRLEINREMLITQQKLEAEKQISLKNKKLLLEEEEKNKEIKGFTNNLMKEKETIVKNEIIKSEKVIQLEDLISRLKMEKDQLAAEIQLKEKNIIDLISEIKKQLATIKQTQDALDKQEHEKQKSIQANKQKQKKLQQKQLEMKNMEINLQKLMSKYDQDTKKLNHQNEESITRFTKQLQEKKTRILQLTNQIQKFTHLQKKLSEQNISLEEQIFFQKQTNSLANSRFDTMNRDIDDFQLKLTQAMREIDLLNEEVRDREEKLFELSNKLYSQDSKLELKDIELREKLQKLDIDWKNKYEQTLEDYEAKIQSYQRQKHYLRQKLEEEMQEISKLENEKRTLIIEEETDKKIFQDKVKKIESERLTLLVEKNREIQKLRQQIEEREEKIKEVKHEKDIKEDDIRRLEEKVRERQQRLISHEQKSQQALNQLEKELQFQKKKQSQLKKYKEFIKNNLWSSEREIKRILQSYIKNIMLLCEQENKNSVIDIMKTVEGQIVKAIQFNLEDN